VERIFITSIEFGSLAKYLSVSKSFDPNLDILFGRTHTYLKKVEKRKELNNIYL